MCDCEEEQRRREEEEREKERLRKQLKSEKSGPARGSPGSGQGSAGSEPCCDDADNCGFFTCGVGSGGGGWLPIAGSALLLAIMAYLYKYLSKMLLGKGRTEGDTSKKSKSKDGRRVSFECPVRK